MKKSVLEKKKINPKKVYLQYPWKFPDSPYYKYLVENPPQRIEYLNSQKQNGAITNKRFFWFSNFLKRNIRRFAKTLGISTPNAHLSLKGNYNLIHCAHCLSKNEDKPWVGDFEGKWQMYIGNESTPGRIKVKQILSNKNCKKILPWTNSAREELVKEFPNLKNKFEVVYPAIPEKKFVKIKKKNINLIFSGRYFFNKGGLHALEVINILTKKYRNVYGIINSEVPEKIKEKYSKNKKIKFHGLISQERLFKIYENSDIFVYPGYSDSFGFGYLEAMSFGLPIITVDGYARKEIVEEGKTGFVINRPKNLDSETLNEQIIQNLIEKTSLLIENKKARKKMSNECIKLIKGGKFSIKERNKKLKRIYEDALK
ncbi:hypothetical protein COU58_02430 [Candidatus Pacearchaeota archaeon CG10_big_fil_rev_8_21_14_0_10_32_42]|nr:MAG: hypothetical protein COU58_02430 [Candidatus Pacearchaeota archaeon CG10_big_fil_rev_8_21_14_0_10_32_42]